MAIYPNFSVCTIKDLQPGSLALGSFYGSMHFMLRTESINQNGWYNVVLLPKLGGNEASDLKYPTHKALDCDLQIINFGMNYDIVIDKIEACSVEFSREYTIGNIMFDKDSHYICAASRSEMREEPILYDLKNFCVEINPKRFVCSAQSWGIYIRELSEVPREVFSWPKLY